MSDEQDYLLKVFILRNPDGTTKAADVKFKIKSDQEFIMAHKTLQHAIDRLENALSKDWHERKQDGRP